MDNEKFVNPDVKEVPAPVREPAKGFALASFFTMGFVNHGDSEVQVKKGLEAFDIDD